MNSILCLDPTHDPDAIYREVFARIAARPFIDGYREAERVIPLANLGDLGEWQEEEIRIWPPIQSRPEPASSEHSDRKPRSAVSQGSPLECDPSHLGLGLQRRPQNEPKPLFDLREEQG